MDVIKCKILITPYGSYVWDSTLSSIFYIAKGSRHWKEIIDLNVKNNNLNGALAASIRHLNRVLKTEVKKSNG